MDVLLHNQFIVVAGALLIPLAGLVSYYDVRYRRIPNRLALATLACGIVMNTLLGGTSGLLSSLGGLVAAFVLMLVMHIFGAMGAGDVKLFGAIGSVVGVGYVLPTFLVVLMTGGALALISIMFAGTFIYTMQRVLQIFIGLLPGWEMPRFAVPTDRRHTIPYGVAITLGSLISLFAFRA